MLYFVALIIGLILDYFIANWFAQIAADKGHPEKKYFWLCFLLGLIGYILVIALPDRGNHQSHNDLPDL